jgi:hypothetical protein
MSVVVTSKTIRRLTRKFPRQYACAQTAAVTAGPTAADASVRLVALRAGISTFDLSRYMGASLTMIDRHYGHLARDGRKHATACSTSSAPDKRPRWTLVDPAWTPKPAPAASQDNGCS